MTTLRDLQEKRAQIWERMKEIRDRVDTDGLMSAEDEAAWDAAEADLERYSKQIEREERSSNFQGLDIVDRGGIAPLTSDITEVTPEDTYRDAFDRYVRDGMGGLEAEQRQVLMRGFVPGSELRAQGVGTATAGGYLVPQGFRNDLVRTMSRYGGVREAVTVIDTESGNTLPWPTMDDTANKGALLAENTQVTEQDATLGQASLGAYMYTSKLIRVSLQLLQDSGVDIEQLLRDVMAERLGRITNEHYTTGTGTSQPEGIQTAAVSGVTLAAGNTTTITADGLIDLVHSVDPAYRNERAAFMLRDSVLGTLRKLKDTTNQYIWQPGLQAGQPDSLLGYPIIVNQDMPAPAANVKSVLFGDFRAGYVIRDVLGIQTLRLEERYADFLQVGFLAFLRTDGRAQNTAAYRALTQSAT